MGADLPAASLPNSRVEGPVGVSRVHPAEVDEHAAVVMLLEELADCYLTEHKRRAKPKSRALVRDSR